jgi:hypothetical protein
MLTEVRHLILKVTVEGITLQIIRRKTLHAIWRKPAPAAYKDGSL